MLESVRMTRHRRHLIASLLIPAAFCAACGQARVVRVEQPTEYARPSQSSASVKSVAAVKSSSPKPAIQPLPDDRTHVVQAGETLYGISFRYGLRYQDVAGWNGIAEPYAIRIGQRLRLQAPAGAAMVAKTTTSPDAPSPFETVPKAATAATSPSVPSKPTPTSTAVVAPPPNTAAPTSPTPATAASVATAATETPRPVTAPAAAAEKPVVAPATGVIVTTPSNASTPTTVNPSLPLPSPPASPATGNAAFAWRWPTQGQIIGRYVSGDQTQQGINIAGKSGQPIAAAADGVVVYSGAGLVGYGELIIIKHSNEWLSAYAHNRRRMVAEGTKVKAGDVIAEMGSSGAIRDMLHFEIRRNGKPVDPLGYLPPR
jgi:lipoprotein NlpD